MVSSVFLLESSVSYLVTAIFVRKFSCARNLYKVCINNKVVIQKSTLVVKIVVAVVVATAAVVKQNNTEEKQNIGSKWS